MTKHDSQVSPVRLYDVAKNVLSQHVKVPNVVKVADEITFAIIASDWLSDRLAEAWDEGRARTTGLAKGASPVNPYRKTGDNHGV